MRRNYSRAVDVVARPDVLVCGAGCAGIGAAVAAALATRASKSTRDVPIAQPQATLREQGAILERPPVAASVPRAALVGNLAH
jgi:hypothetical protein